MKWVALAAVAALLGCESLRVDYGSSGDLQCFTVDGKPITLDATYRTKGAWCKVVMTDETS